MKNYENFAIIKAGLFTFAFVLGMFGNCLVIIATKKFESLQKPINVFVCNLCVVDIMMLITGIPLVVFSEANEQLNCNTFKPLLAILINANVFTLVAIAIERYFVLHTTALAKKLNLRKSFLLTSVLNVAAILIGLPGIFAFEKAVNGKCVSRWPEYVTNVTAVVLFLIQYITPLMIITILYVRIWYKIRNKNNITIKIFNTNKTSISHSVSESNLFKRDIESVRDKRLSMHSIYGSHLNGHDLASSMIDVTKLERSNTFPGISRSNSLIESVNKVQRRFSTLITGMDRDESDNELSTYRYHQTTSTLKVFMILVLVFCICMLPKHITMFIQISNLDIKLWLHSLLDSLVYINATINPWLYGGLNPQFQNTFRNMFSRSRCRKKIVGLKDVNRSAKGIAIFKKRFPDDFSDCDSECSRRSDRQRLNSDRVFDRISSREDTTIPTLAPIIIITNYEDDVESPF